MSFFGESKISAKDSPSIDAFGRWRTSQPVTLFESKLLYDKAALVWDESLAGGAAAATYTAPTAVMNVTANGHSVIRQSKRRFNYHPGKSQLAIITGILGTFVASTSKRIGLFDANNGFFFQTTGSVTQVVRRKAAADTAVSQTSWNLDTMAGAGPSGKTLDLSKSQIFVIDFQWLGVGRIRMGVVIAGVIIYVHQFTWSNEQTGVTVNTPNLPVRYEITSTGGTASITQICSAIISEGGRDVGGIHLAGGTPMATGIALATAGTYYPIFGLRLTSTKLDATVLVGTVAAMLLGNAEGHWRLELNPTLSAAATFTALTNSVVDTAPGDGTLTISTPGTLLASGYMVGNTADSSSELSMPQLGSTIAGVADQIWLTMSANANTKTAFGSLHWRELA